MSESASAEDGGGLARKAPRPAKGAERRGLFARIALFVRQVIAELKKVVRPTRDDLVRYSIVVIVFVLIVMAFVTVIDLGAGTLVGWVFGG
ncbi:preprotein translocase subunit SecE [Actinotalea sp.]|uniref:preprotein translocase subunit SecE n=1 Tax=Actinotalea sp. TaxID=1872145 RepID=UPI00356495C3